MPPNSWAWLASRGCLVLGGLLIGSAAFGALELHRAGRELSVYLRLAIVGGIGIGVVGLALLAHAFE